MDTQWPASLWTASAGPEPDFAMLNGDKQTEVCIVGGGFTGLSAALHLAERGHLATVLEAQAPGWGASGRNGGQVIPGLKLDPDVIERRYGRERGAKVVDFAATAPDLVFDLISRYNINCQAERNGWIQAIHATSAKTIVEQRARQWQQRGAEVELLDRQQTADLLGTARYIGAMLDKRGGKLQPLAYARALAIAAERRGAMVHAHSPALTVQRHRQHWQVTTPQGSVTADTVLLCTNGYTDQLWPKLERSIIPAFSYQIATRPLSDNLLHSILPQGQVVSDTRRLLVYFRTDHTGRLLVGGRGKFKDSSKPAMYRHVIKELKQLFPQVATDIDYYWGGKVALTTDHLPHLHELAPGVLTALGYNGRGIAMATAMGKLLANWAAGDPAESLPFPVTPLRSIAMHKLRRPALQLAVIWNQWRDR